MGIYYSLMSVFSAPTSTTNRNVHSLTRFKTSKKRRRRHKRHHLLNRFFLGSNQYFLNTQQTQTCLFHEQYTLNSSCDNLLPVNLHLTLTELTHPSITNPIKCAVAIRRDSLKLIHCSENCYSIDFIFDCDRPIQIYIYFMVHEIHKDNSTNLSYICCKNVNESDTFKQYYAFVRPAGYRQVFSSCKNDIRFPLTALKEENYHCTITNQLHPIVIICKEIDIALLKNPSTICGTTINHYNTAATAVLPEFDQYHVILATVKHLRLNNTTNSDHVSILLLSQKHIYDGIIFKLYEFYGIEHQSSIINRNDRRKLYQKRKSMTKAITTPTIAENETFSITNGINDRSLVNQENKQICKPKASLSCMDLMFNKNNESTCVICLTDMRNILLLPCRHLCLCETCAENLKFQSANCPICRVPFRALLQINALRYRDIHHSDSDENDDEYVYESISLIDALNLATTKTYRHTLKQITTNDFYTNHRPIMTTDLKYFCSEHNV